MKNTKKTNRGITVFALMSVLALVGSLVLAGCGGSSVIDPSTKEPVTYSGTRNNVNYTLVVGQPPGRSAHQTGDTYTLTVKSSTTDKVSSGTVVSFNGNILVLKPSCNEQRKKQHLTKNIYCSNITNSETCLQTEGF